MTNIEKAQLVEARIKRLSMKGNSNIVAKQLRRLRRLQNMN